MGEKSHKKSVYDKYVGGPHGLGDPDDKSLRKVEIDVMIPKKMREIAKTEKCFKEVEAFTICCKDSGLLMVWKCREQNSMLKECLTHWYQDEDFRNRCTKEYLEERTEYRRTGVTLKQKQRIGSSM
ncbi:unnamed protein product [Acanthoscelides obtectus]|uniref:COX assembly mitochondrial protein n=1 Tax=Acanthoscelides obtectus TaxID=200917 RepID=A0A9P0KWK4_ACAOB|nr:unnamed protein product [Acanthoscelides obtectus]CAK1674976.1 COX assembly mitochondrial protein homolog [Acanthoscelides obtectus]